jgi:hypothetical protein
MSQFCFYELFLDLGMRTVKRPRRYVARHWLVALRPFFRYSSPRSAYVLRGVGGRVGPVLRAERRHERRPLEGADRRRVRAA